MQVAAGSSLSLLSIFSYLSRFNLTAALDKLSTDKSSLRLVSLSLTARHLLPSLHMLPTHLLRLQLQKYSALLNIFILHLLTCKDDMLT